MIFGERLRGVLADNDIPHVDLSRDTGISPANISHMLAGRNPSYKTLCKVLKALPESVNIRELLLGK